MLIPTRTDPDASLSLSSGPTAPKHNPRGGVDESRDTGCCHTRDIPKPSHHPVDTFPSGQSIWGALSSSCVAPGQSPSCLVHFFLHLQTGLMHLTCSVLPRAALVKNIAQNHDYFRARAGAAALGAAASIHLGGNEAQRKAPEWPPGAPLAGCN